MDLVLTAGWLAISRPPMQEGDDAEAVAVLWGGAHRFSPEDKRRVAHAAKLWHAGNPTRLVFCIGGFRPETGFSGARLLCERLAAAGVPQERLRVGSGSRDTISNLDEAASLARREGLHRVAIVGDRLQAFRASRFLRRNTADPSLVWRPYLYESAAPPVSLGFLWWRVHHEWLAIASLALPDPIRTKLLGLLRR